MNEHTPGPWMILNPNICGDDECDIVEVNRTAPFGEKYKIATVCWKRDRNLIIAAPDLLAACKRAMELDSVSPNCDEIYNELRDAIRKAESE